MARVPPFTHLSLQFEGARAEVLDLNPEEVRLLREALFDEALSERLLQTINLAENRFLRDVALETRSVSAHARLAALAEHADALIARG